MLLAFADEVAGRAQPGEWPLPLLGARVALLPQRACVVLRLADVVTCTRTAVILPAFGVACVSGALCSPLAALAPRRLARP
jgi:hypothetical protein